MYVFKVLSEEGGNPIGRNIALPWESNTTSQLLSFLSPILIMRGFPGGAVVKNLPANAGDPRNAGLIPGSGRSLEKEMATHSSILAWRIPWTEEPGGYGP